MRRVHYQISLYPENRKTKIKTRQTSGVEVENLEGTNMMRDVSKRPNAKVIPYLPRGAQNPLLSGRLN